MYSHINLSVMYVYRTRRLVMCRQQQMLQEHKHLTGWVKEHITECNTHTHTRTHICTNVYVCYVYHEGLFAPTTPYRLLQYILYQAHIYTLLHIILTVTLLVSTLCVQLICIFTKRQNITREN